MHDFEFKLVGHSSEAGQILAQDMVSLAGSAQALVTRIARAAAERRGPGRAEAALEHLSRVRLTGLSAGSTTLAFTFGDAEALDIDDPISREIDETFWLIAEGMEQNRRPAEVSDSIAAAVDELIGAFRHAAPSVEVRFPGGPTVRLKPHSLDRRIWQSGPEMASTELSYIGNLEALDLRNGTFRIVDDVANRIALRDVRSPHEAAQLVDRRVRATGRPAYAPDGALRYLADVELAAQDLPPGWIQPEPGLAYLVRSTPGPSAGGGLDLTDEEYDRFITAIHG